MENHDQSGCTPDKCDSCTGCGGEIEKISLRVEWRHKGDTAEKPTEIEESVNTLAKELAVSGVELIYINNTFSSDISEGTSEFRVNGHNLGDLVPLASGSPVSCEILRKGIFQALLRNI